MKAELKRVVAQIEVQPIGLDAVINRGRRQAAWGVTALSIASVVLSVALIAGGIAARGLVRQEDNSPPGAPLRAAAKVIGPRQVIVTWKAAVDDVGVTGYEIQRNGREIETVDGTTLSHTDSTVRPGRKYRYRIVALDNAGNRSDRSKLAVVTTPKSPDGGQDDIQPPSTPSLTAVADSNGVALSWTPSEDDVDLAGYTIYRDGNAIIQRDESATSFTDGEVESGMTYTYEVEAFDASGNRSARSNQVTVETPTTNTPPTAPANVTAAHEGSGARLNWSASSDDVGVARYDILRDGTKIGDVPPSETTFLDSSDLCEGTYTFEVVAVDGADSKSEPGSAQLTVICVE